MDAVNNLLRNLMMAQRCAHVHHWQTKSFAQHMALGDLYEQLTEFADELAELYMGMTGQTVAPEQSDPNHFSQQDAVEFIRQLHDVLADLKNGLPQDGQFINKFEELQAAVDKVKYKLEQLK